MAKNKPARPTAAEWEVERAKQHMQRGMNEISRGGGLAAVGPHLAQAKACFIRAFEGRLDHPLAMNLLQRLETMQASVINAKGGQS